MADDSPRSPGFNLYRGTAPIGFKESLRRGPAQLTPLGNAAAVYRGPLPFAVLHPAAPAVAAHASVLPWLLLAGLLAVIVVGGYFLSSRH